MKTIVVATDFSERSDRAIRRAFHVVLGDPFIGITQTARVLGANLIVIGPHRRQLLLDIFVGTTAERTIRTSDRPVLLANGIPTGSYRRAIVATDLSAYSETTIRTAKSLGLLDRMNVSLLHVFNVPAAGLMRRASFSDAEKQSYIAGEWKRASEEATLFIDKINVDGMSTILKPATADVGDTICATAEELSAELIVIGTCGRSVIARTLIGSVTEGVMRNSDRDVLAVPPQQNGTVS